MKAFSLLAVALFLTALVTPVSAETSVTVLRAAEAEYPRTALRRGLTGEVLVEYSVNEQGRAEDIRILDSGSRVFEPAAIRAVQNSIYMPVEQDGNLVKVSGVQRLFVFDLPNQ
jgi:TonB family protein